jgi:small-conductance mechanosensitive channel
MDKVVEVLKDVAIRNEQIDTELTPRVRCRAFGDSSINVELLCWVKHPAQRGAVIHQLILQIIKRFREEQIEIPFPQRDLHVRDMPQQV